jgi:hypothetical protein
LNEAIARLLDKDECHIGLTGIEIDWAVHVQRGSLVVSRYAGDTARGSERQIEQAHLSGGTDPQSPPYRTVESKDFLR